MSQKNRIFHIVPCTGVTLWTPQLIDLDLSLIVLEGHKDIEFFTLCHVHGPLSGHYNLFNHLTLTWFQPISYDDDIVVHKTCCFDLDLFFWTFLQGHKNFSHFVP